MPFKSEAQRRLMHAKAARGQVSKATVRHWQQATGTKRLPQHVRRSKVR